jgi:hypothetical protein
MVCDRLRRLMDDVYLGSRAVQHLLIVDHRRVNRLMNRATALYPALQTADRSVRIDRA